MRHNRPLCLGDDVRAIMSLGDFVRLPLVLCSCENSHCVGLLCIVPPRGCEAILIEILRPKRYCLVVKLPLARNIAVRKTDDKICNNALFHIKRPRSINVRTPMKCFDLLYVSLLIRKQNIKCGPSVLMLQDFI